MQYDLNTQESAGIGESQEPWALWGYLGFAMFRTCVICGDSCKWDWILEHLICISEEVSTGLRHLAEAVSYMRCIADSASCN